MRDNKLICRLIRDIVMNAGFHCERLGMQWCLGNETIARGYAEDTSHGNCDTKHEKVPVKGSAFLELHVFRLRDNAADIVVEEEQDSNDEARKDSSKDPSTGDVRQVNQPCSSR